jgi:hypothetical protein
MIIGADFFVKSNQSLQLQKIEVCMNSAMLHCSTAAIAIICKVVKNGILQKIGKGKLNRGIVTLIIRLYKSHKPQLYAYKIALDKKL